MAVVNGITRGRARELVFAATDVWVRRSALDWTVVVDPELVERFPALADLPARAVRSGRAAG
jgi:hypothetical protein